MPVLAGTVVAAPALLDANHLLSTYGLIGILIIIFAECGLLIGFFLPGDTLLFSAGLLMAIGTLNVNIWLATVLVPIAAVLGNLTGYWIGAKAGPRVFDRPKSRMFKPEYVTRSEAFFARYGAPAIVLARFVPVVRTVATVLAGVGRMRYSVYATYSVIGGVLWADGVMLTGYWLGHIRFVRDTVEPLIDPILVGVVVLSLLPIAIHWLRTRRQQPAQPSLD
ncbi:MAG: VTT domain-containing protein [Actinomycetota bacterium]|nr:VTT domain-containing protein [Actinomycetota bacterium]